jgi:hypothetical protein
MSTFLWCDMDRMGKDAAKNSSTVAYVFVAAVGFLTSRCLATVGDTHIDTKTDGRDLGSTPLRWAHMPRHTRIHKGWFSDLKVDRGDAQAHRQLSGRISPPLFF